jgi:TetR/AcrR family transcriptional regulator, regulator of biofilm formation and stress response
MERTHSNILEAALGVIVKGGVGAVRYREVAAAAGVALGTISYQYSSREELIRATFEYFLQQGTTALRELAVSTRVSTAEELAALITNIVRAEILDPKRTRLAEYELIVFAARDPALARALVEFDRTLIAELGALVERIGGTAPFSTAQSILELTRGFQIVALSQPAPDFEDLEKRMLRLILGFYPQRPDVKRPEASARVRRKRD